MGSYKRTEKRKEYEHQWYLDNKERVLEYRRVWRLNNLERVRIRQRKYRQDNLEKHHGYERKHRHGITSDDYDAMRAAQENKCAICLSETTLVVDHDHDKEKGEGIRKLLCDRCNVGLGNFKDSSELLDAAAQYLKEFGK